MTSLKLEDLGEEARKEIRQDGPPATLQTAGFKKMNGNLTWVFPRIGVPKNGDGL